MNQICDEADGQAADRLRRLAADKLNAAIFCFPRKSTVTR